MMYEAVIAGGTFDRLHTGHKSFLDMAFKHGKKVFIGLTTQDMLRKTVRPEEIQPYEKREKVLEEYIKKYKKPYEITPIKDIFGFSTELEDSYAIVASKETKPTCETINKVRRTKGLKELKIIFVPFVYSEDCRVISSSRIRKEEIDEEGKVRIDYKITERLREELKTPVGKIFESDYDDYQFATDNLLSHIEKEKIKNVICVGDQVSHDLINSHYIPRNVIVDGKVMRRQLGIDEALLKLYSENFDLKNPPGLISRGAWQILKNALKTESLVSVKGEEDLLVFPVVLLAENKTAVVYGQPGRGKVLVEVNDDKKEELRKRLSEFDTVK